MYTHVNDREGGERQAEGARAIHYTGFRVDKFKINSNCVLAHGALPVSPLHSMFVWILFFFFCWNFHSALYAIPDAYMSSIHACTQLYRIMAQIKLK